MEEIRENKKGFKKTEIGYIPDDWKIVELGKVGDIINGLTYSPDDVSSSGILVLRSSNVQNKTLDFKDEVFVDVEASKINPVETNDILICVRNGSKNLIGKNAIITNEHQGHAFGAFMTVYRSQYNPYIFQVFDTDIYYKQVFQNLGATINSINGSELNKFKIPFPPLPEQQKIASILSKWDELIETQTQLIEEKEKQKKGLMQKLLTGEVRFPGFEEEWEEVRLGDICKKKSSNLSANSLGDNEGQYKVYGATGFLQYTDFYNEDKEFISIVKDGAGVGRVLLCEAKSSVLGTLEVISPKEKVDIFYLYSILQSINFKKYITGSTIPHVYFKDYANEKIRIPGYAEQQEVAKFLFNCDEEIQLLKDELEAIKLQKKGLMQQLLTGKIRVKI